MSNPTTPSPSGRQARVIFMIGCAIALFIFAAAVLYVRWASMTEPTCVIVVDATPALRDAKVKVDGVTLINGALTATIGSDNRYSIPFYLDAGEYTVEVTLSDRLLYRKKVALAPRTYFPVDLRSIHPAADEALDVPATMPF